MSNNSLTPPLYESLLAYVERRVGSQADAEDLLQQILLKVLATAPPKEEFFRPWLFRVAHNAVVDAQRKNARGPRAAATDPELMAAETSSETNATTEIAGYLVRLVEKLSEPDREALTMVEMDGQSQKDYAKDRALSYVTAKSRVQRARTRLRRELERHCVLELDGRGVPIACIPKSSNCCE